MNDVQSILREILLPYQLTWVNDPARFKIGMWSRQTGKSFGTACEAVADCVLHPGAMWVVLSAGERQALEWMEKAKTWAKAFGLIVDSYQELRGSADSVMARAEIRFSNGSRIVAIPANPATARGYSANLILDEFAIHEKPWDIWAAIYPSITNPLTGEKKLRIVSTPKGRANKFYDLWTKNESYSKHKVTIIDAVAQGLPVNIDELRAGVDDPDIWAQEYMCEFIDSSGVLLPYELIAACESDAADPADAAPLYVGMDVGRSKDLSVIIVGARRGDTLHVNRVELLPRMPFAEQLAVLSGILSDPRVARCCIDATGIGAMLAEEAGRKFSCVEGVVFTSSSKGEMYQAMRRCFDDRTVRIPVSRDLREDLHAVERNVSGSGNISYSAARTADGHSDRASALALMIRAASQAVCNMPPRPGTGRRAAARRARLTAIRNRSSL
jgi:phage FluMu gp28-like protein